MTTVLVTGATGYLGGRLCQALSADASHKVRATVRHPTAGYPAADDVVAVDLLTSPMTRLAEVCEGVDTVVHLAAPNEVACTTDPERSVGETVVTTHRITSAAATAGVTRLVYISTFHVYGAAAAPGALLTEDTVPEPRGAYGIGHLAAEHAAVAAGNRALEVVRLRVTNLIGAPAHPSVSRWSLLTNDLCRRAALGEPLVVRTTTAWRDFVTQVDTCAIIATSLDPATVPAGTYNAGSGSVLTVLQLAQLVQEVAEELTGRRPELRTPAALGPGEAPCRVSSERLGRLGIRATTSVRSAIEETMLFCLANKQALR